MSLRFTVRDLPGPEPLVEKLGPAGALAREAQGLRAVAGRPWAPRLVAAGPGRVVATRCPGAPRPLAGLSPDEARRLGEVLRELHDLRRSAEGGLPWWPPPPARSLGEYRDRRAADAQVALAGTPHEGLPSRAVAAAPLPLRPGGAPFRLLHGDLVEANVVWGPDGPALVDWEFWRMGDPAEDLAYAIELNRMPERLAAALLAGYDDPPAAEAVPAWRALVCLDAGAWYLAEGMTAQAGPLLSRGASLVRG